jgi:hypothetical protein
MAAQRVPDESAANLVDVRGALGGWRPNARRAQLTLDDAAETFLGAGADRVLLKIGAAIFGARKRRRLLRTCGHVSAE